MDVDLWPSKVHSSKHLSVVRAARLNSDECEDETEDGQLDYESNCDEDGHYDDFDGDEDTRACFPCPFCYVEIEIHALCTHLQEEHCFDLKNSVCPLCAANLGKDVIGHFIVQHASSLKRRRKSQKSGCWPGTPATLSRELSLFIGSSTGDRDNAHESAPDLILSPFLCNAPVSDTKDILRDKCSDGETSVTSNLKRTEPPFLDKDHEQNTEERRQKAAFVLQLVMSTIF
ncbi:PREDICTED: protein DEHYDRATION-INDUCED 19 homolog 6 isoform X2 [Theobroma cacao]|uniref:Protein DEHYDRATION-INDUCED 19 homolog 6 isoform X2 n=1 Tax=Theobroma cacao TaxID=3641 RepID=A0AB32VBI1_THECC|nr:PREDICTED: protein DEHYDRATION-INDUCED 19 homolog 6 isoform X2 [Theobroma cacao]